MALVAKRIERLEHPNEDGAWFDVSVPLSAGDLAGMRLDGLVLGMSLDLMAAVVKGWSYGVAVSPEALDSLDIDTFMWLSSEIMQRSNIRSDAEKKDSNGSSSPGLDPAPDATPRS